MTLLTPEQKSLDDEQLMGLIREAMQVAHNRGISIRFSARFLDLMRSPEGRGAAGPARVAP